MLYRTLTQSFCLLYLSSGCTNFREFLISRKCRISQFRELGAYFAKKYGLSFSLMFVSRKFSLAKITDKKAFIEYSYLSAKNTQEQQRLVNGYRHVTNIVQNLMVILLDSNLFNKNGILVMSLF